MSTSCLALWPASECGWLGQCVNTTICVCDDDSWTHSKEMTFFIEDGAADTTMMCTHNKTILSILYGIITTMSIVGFIVQLAAIKERSQISRALPFLGYCMFCASFSIYRLVDPDHALLGVDTLFTFLVSSAIIMLCVTSNMFGRKYTLYLAKAFPFANDRLRWSAKFFLKVMPLVIFFDTVIWNFLWIGTLPKRNAIKLRIYRFVFVWALLRYIYGFLTYYIMKQYILDMKELVNGKQRLESYNCSQVNVAYITKLKKTIKTTIFMRRNFLLLPVFTWPVFVLPLFWNFWVQNWGYVLPIIFPLQFLGSYAAIYGNFKTRKLRTDPQMLITTGDVNAEWTVDGEDSKGRLVSSPMTTTTITSQKSVGDKDVL